MPSRGGDSLGAFESVYCRNFPPLCPLRSCSKSRHTRASKKHQFLDWYLEKTEAYQEQELGIESQGLLERARVAAEKQYRLRCL